MQFEDTQRDLIPKLYHAFSDCMQQKENVVVLNDPFENHPIGFHYGETHFAVAFIIYGVLNHAKDIENTGYGLLNFFITNLPKYKKYPEYHWDFNNVALCVLIEFLESHHMDTPDYTVDQLKKILIDQEDSKHGTVNWMPMRAFVNWCKYQWSDDSKYLEKVDSYLKNVKNAKYEDGFFEDFLPKGKSFNFQYHIYTTAMLDFLSSRMNIVEKPIQAIENIEAIVDVEGDINYLGRGCNQIFAWGPALFTMYNNGMDNALKRCSTYFNSIIDVAINNKNIILSDIPGKYRIWWWDYHYTTVYFGHLAFWIALTLICGVQKMDNIAKMENSRSIQDSGVRIFKNENAFVTVFDGRKHYLAEQGPVVANIGFISKGTLFKGPLGPHAGQFGNKYANYHASVCNYFGLIQQKIIAGYTVEKNVFPHSIDIEMAKDTVLIKFIYKRNLKDVYFSLPLLKENDGVLISILTDQGTQDIIPDGTYIGPYGETKRFITRSFACQTVIVKIKVV